MKVSFINSCNYLKINADSNQKKRQKHTQNTNKLNEQNKNKKTIKTKQQKQTKVSGFLFDTLNSFKVSVKL